jgi:hypothetical protein
MIDSILGKHFGRQLEQVAEDSETDTDLPDSLGAFGWLRGARDRAVMLELRKKDGNVLAVGYAWLERAEYDPSVGITLHVGGKTVSITGRNLNMELRPNLRLFQGLTRHRVPWIQEADTPAVIEFDGRGTLVEKIDW